jgi:hypothetical protein
MAPVARKFCDPRRAAGHPRLRVSLTHGDVPQLGEPNIRCSADGGEAWHININVMNIQKRDPSYTRRDPRPGAVHRLYHRITELQPGWELCASYLLVQSLNGDEFYIPSGISAGCDAQTEHFLLAATASSFQKKMWTRPPVFSFSAQSGRKHSQSGGQSRRISHRGCHTRVTSTDFLRWLRERKALAQQVTEVDTERTAPPQDGN